MSLCLSRGGRGVAHRRAADATAQSVRCLLDLFGSLASNPSLPLLTFHPSAPTQAAAIGAMFLCTMAGSVDAAELSMYSALLMDSSNSEMIEFLMAGMWILLRCGSRLHHTWIYP